VGFVPRYTSVFVHYYPKDNWYEVDHDLEAHYAIPPHWREDRDIELTHTPLKMVQTSFTEPECPDNWCGTLDTVTWGGPAEYGTLLLPTTERIPFHPPPYNDEL